MRVSNKDYMVAGVKCAIGFNVSTEFEFLSHAYEVNEFLIQK